MKQGADFLGVFRHVQKMIVYAIMVGNIPDSNSPDQPLINRVINATCQCFTGVNTDEHVQLQIIKVSKQANIHTSKQANTSKHKQTNKTTDFHLKFMFEIMIHSFLRVNFL